MIKHESIDQLKEMADPALFWNYYRDNEQYMEDQWNWFIWPHIKDLDFSYVADIACGHGRNTRKFLDCGRSESVFMLDINQVALESCKNRFEHVKTPKMHFIETDGNDLSMIPDKRLTLIYSWDSMVHFDLPVIERYFKGFSRIMADGGSGFIHHSNFGALPKVSSYWKDNPGWRSKVSAADIYELADSVGLEVTKQFFIEWDYVKESDCVTLFRKRL